MNTGKKKALKDKSKKCTYARRMGGQVVEIHFFLDVFTKLRKSDYHLRNVCPSFRPQGTTRLPLDGFSLNLIFECFSKICREGGKQLQTTPMNLPRMQRTRAIPIA